MESLVYEFGVTGTIINVGTMPSGLQSVINGGKLVISGTPVFTDNDYSFSVFTSDGNANCNQVSQTIALSKKDSPSLTLDSGAYNQTIDLGNSMTPIVVSYGGATSSLTITGLSYTQSGSTVTIDETFTIGGRYNGTITIISNSTGCNEITQNIAVTVNAPVITNTGGTTLGGNTSSAPSTISCQNSISDDLGTLNVTSSLSKNSDGTGAFLIDDFEIQLVAGSWSTLSGKFKASSLNITNCSSGNGIQYTLSGPFIHKSGFDSIFNAGQSYTINQMSNLIKNAYISIGFSTCESSSSCEMLGIGRVDV